MTEPLSEWVGFFAAILTTVSFVPQAWLVIRTRRTGGISLLMYSLFVAGVALWFLYGVMVGALPIIVANAITLGLAGTILTLAARERYSRRGTLKARPPGTPLPNTLDPDRS